MGSKVLPTMSIFGMTKDSNIITEKLFLYFITSEYSQSVTFYGEISSLKYLLNQYASEPELLKNEIYETLLILYKKYFDNVEIEVDIKQDKNKKNSIEIKITTEDENGVVSTINETLTTSGTTITNLLELIYK